MRGCTQSILGSLTVFLQRMAGKPLRRYRPKDAARLESALILHLIERAARGCRRGGLRTARSLDAPGGQERSFAFPISRPGTRTQLISGHPAV
jgi:hypothetical protein